ncbi:NYN domain-containing protein [Kingella kingae]|uniref:NYN domain-containing protein n=1 Tax=Kingella kingae TaxID=504 RepID=UPI00254F941E|nr:NYN domain-containing protein [Kingella kingae]MDK4591009.1 NYN domain-containing protein [Kingella kingae]MDK4651225.1 NYN domain-containing protein [Kingella kingae]
MGAIVLVTADSDFVPAIKLARMEGVQIFLAHLGHTVKPELKEHSDVLLDNISAAQ